MWRHLILTLDNCSACCRRNKMHVTNGPWGTTERYTNAFVTAVSIHTLTDTWELVQLYGELITSGKLVFVHTFIWIHTIMMHSIILYTVVYKVTLSNDCHCPIPFPLLFPPSSSLPILQVLYNFMVNFYNFRLIGIRLHFGMHTYI